MKESGIPIANGTLSRTPEEAEAAFVKNSTMIVRHYFEGMKGAVIKAQVLAGGRGKGVFDNGFVGGVHKVNSAEEAKRVASKMLGHRLKTKQTGGLGALCKAVRVLLGMINVGLFVRESQCHAGKVHLDTLGQGIEGMLACASFQVTGDRSQRARRG